MATIYVPDSDFALVIKNAPLVSIDLIIRDGSGQVLLGLRQNEPAKGTYFVPGGVIRKSEKIADAFARIVWAELGLAAHIDAARFIGVFEHFYATNRYGDSSYGTHYVVLAHEMELSERPMIVLDSQHRDVRWMSPDDIRRSREVHPNTKAYFLENRDPRYLS